MKNPDVFMSRIARSDTGCWLWTGKPNASGYGTYGPQLAHRVAFELFIRPLRDGEQVDHLCHDPATCQGGDSCPHRACVCPAHLEAVPPKINVARSGGLAAINARKTHCPQGHPYDEANTRPVAAEGKRRCRICRAEQFRRARQRQRERALAAM